MRRRELLKFCGCAVPALAFEPVLPRARGYDVPTPAEGAVGIVPKNYGYPPLNVLRYGAVGDGSTDDGSAIRAAWLVAKQQGGGTILFPNAATYLVSSLDPASPIKLPQQQSSGLITNQPYQTQLYFQNGTNVVFDFQGSTLKTNLIGGGNFIVLDGCTNIRMLGPKITGAQVMSTGVATLGTLSGGSGYADGTYRSVPLTGGAGGGAVADVAVRGGEVISVTIVYPGGSYAVGNILTCKNAALGGRGSGFSVPVTSVSGVGPRVAVAAPNAVVCSALSRPSDNIIISDLDVSAMYTGLYVVNEPNSANTITHVSLLGRSRVLNGEYGIALHNGGDDALIESLYTYRISRPFFFYGVRNVKVTCVGDQTNFGFQALVKAYSRSTRNITIRYSATNQQGQSGAVGKVVFQVQHDPAVIDPPPTVQAVDLEYDESNVTVGGNGIEFDYYAGPGGLTLQSSSPHQLFNDFVIRGVTRNTLMSTVALNGAAASCRIDLDKLQFARPKAANELSNNGFIRK